MPAFRAHKHKCWFKSLPLRRRIAYRSGAQMDLEGCVHRCGYLCAMFNRYWRSYPWFFQLFQLVILIFIMLSFVGGVLTPLVVQQTTGYDLSALSQITDHSPERQKSAALLAQGLFSIGLFVAPPLLFAYVTHPRPGQYLGLRAPGRAVQVVLSLLLIVALMPVESQLAAWISRLPWPQDMRANEARMAGYAEALITPKTAGAYWLCMLVASVIPAFGEELFFRGIVMRFAAKRFSAIWLPLAISALMFSIAHASAFNFLPIALAGFVLGIIYYFTGSLWLSMLAHLVHNGLQITLFYVMRDNASFIRMMAENEVPVWLFILCLLAAVGLLWGLHRQATPLPARWMEDYEPGEERE